MIVVKVVSATFLADTTLTTDTLSPGDLSVARTSRKGVRNHSPEFKLRLVTEACKPGVSVAKLAREHGINANLLFKWRLKHQRSGLGGISGTPTLLPVRTQEFPVVEVAAPEPSISARSASLQVSIEHGPFTIRFSGPLNRQDLGIVLDCLASQRS